jgi:hypothetical protein
MAFFFGFPLTGWHLDSFDWMGIRTPLAGWHFLMIFDEEFDELHDR